MSAATELHVLRSIHEASSAVVRVRVAWQKSRAKAPLAHEALRATATARNVVTRRNTSLQISKGQKLDRSAASVLHNTTPDSLQAHRVA